MALGTGLENLGSRDRIGQYYSASRDGHQIHPRRMTRIDSVKINPPLVMMRECDMILIKVSITLTFFTMSEVLAMVPFGPRCYQPPKFQHVLVAGKIF